MLIEKILIVLIVCVVGLGFLAVNESIEAKKECIAQGGDWIVTGTNTSYVLTGKVMVPVTTEEYTCKEK